jgi:DNA modification methylase
MQSIVRIGDATLYHGDALQIVALLPPVDLVLTDPPYGACRRIQEAYDKRLTTASPLS